MSQSIVLREAKGNAIGPSLIDRVIEQVGKSGPGSGSEIVISGVPIVSFMDHKGYPNILSDDNSSSADVKIRQEWDIRHPRSACLHRHLVQE